MTVSWNQGNDGAISLFIDDDLQFDSQDERIYHECLALPALAIAKQRTSQPLRVMVAGGADGLTVRELLKDEAVASVDLIDYDSEVIHLGKTAFAQLNDNSLTNTRVKLHIEDAWEYARRSIADGYTYDLIICDLTVPADLASARLHSVEWYEMLQQLVGANGIIVANSVSPSQTPRAYWSIINSIRSAKLTPLPFRVAIPSFRNMGYGEDWGFIMASQQPITETELLSETHYAGPRHELKTSQQMKALCQLPLELLSYSTLGAPAKQTSDALIDYMFGDEPLMSNGTYWNSITTDWNHLSIPEAQTKIFLLPPDIREALGDEIYDEETLFQRVLSLVPALRRFQTRKMIADFLADPRLFLDAIDLPALVEKLLKRASELPQKLLTELQLLRERLVDWAGDYRALLSAGSRVITILTVVVIIGNLMYPDSAYAKGEHGGGGHHEAGGHHEGGDHADRGGDHRDAGRREGNGDRRGFGDHYDHYGHWGNFDHYNRFNSWNRHWGWDGWGRAWHGWNGGYYGWEAPVYAGSGGYVNVNVNDNTGQTVDAEGNSYPARKYSTAQNCDQDYNADASGQANGTDESDFRLGPDTDVLKGGKVAVHLTDKAYMLLGPDKTMVIDQDSGNPIMSLSTDPTLLWHVASELKRQSLGLQSSAQSKQSSLAWSGSTQMSGNGQADDGSGEANNIQAAVDLLNQAASNLGTPQKPDGPTAPPVTGAVELFASVWLSPDGKYVIVKRPSGDLDYIAKDKWYSDAGQTAMAKPFPSKFKQTVVAYMNTMVQESSSAQSEMTQEKQEASDRLTALQQRLQNMQANKPGEDDNAGPNAQPGEAERRLRMAIKRTDMRLKAISKQLDLLPVEVALSQKTLTTLQ